MLGDISGLERIYIVCGYTDMRKSIDGLCAVVEDQLKLDPASSALFLFCGRRRDRIKALFRDADGFVLIYKKLTVHGGYQWTVISAVNCTYPKADEKEMEFVFDYAKELETCMVMQDKRWLGEAVINVLDNAIKYSPDGSKIFIRLQKRNDLVRMEIEDQGIGIPQNEYHKIFQRFYRGSSKEVMEKSGTGIGLFLSREIIEKHAGTITVTSGKKKKGSTFVIQLPYVG